MMQLLPRTADVDDVAVARQAVDERGDHYLVAEHGTPIP